MIEHESEQLRAAPRLPVLSVAEIHQSMNDVLAAYELSITDPELANQLVVCIITLLQNVTLPTGVASHIRAFAVAVSSRAVALVAHGDLSGHVFQFPVP